MYMRYPFRERVYWCLINVVEHLRLLFFSELAIKPALNAALIPSHAKNAGTAANSSTDSPTSSTSSTALMDGGTSSSVATAAS